MTQLDIIQQGLALEKKVHKRIAYIDAENRRLNIERWEFADWLVANVYTSPRKPQLAALEPIKRSHMISMGEYVKHSTYSRQYLYLQRNASLIAPPTFRTDDTALDVVTKLWNLHGDIAKVRGDIPRKTLVRGYRREYSTYMDVVENLERTVLSGLRGTLKRLGEIENGMDEDTLEKAGEVFNHIYDFLREVEHEFGMDKATLVAA